MHVIVVCWQLEKKNCIIICFTITSFSDLASLFFSQVWPSLEMFATATKKFVKEVDPCGVLTPVSSLNNSIDLLTVVVVKRRSFWFNQKPKYFPTKFHLSSLLTGDTAISPGRHQRKLCVVTMYSIYVILISTVVLWMFPCPQKPKSQTSSLIFKGHMMTALTEASTQVIWTPKWAWGARTCQNSSHRLVGWRKRKQMWRSCWKTPKAGKCPTCVHCPFCFKQTLAAS